LIGDDEIYEEECDCDFDEDVDFKCICGWNENITLDEHKSFQDVRVVSQHDPDYYTEISRGQKVRNKISARIRR